MKSNKSVAYLFLFIVLGGLAYSCQNRPKEVLSRKQMERLMYDVYIAEVTMENDYQNFNTLEQKEAYINRIFRVHKVTPAQWDSSLSWYSDRIDLYLKMNDSVKARLQRSRQDIDALLAQQNQNQLDPALLRPSYVPPFYAFSMPDARRGFRFHLDSVDISSKVDGDDFVFSFTVMGIPSHFSSSFISLLRLDYSDTTLYRFQKINENRTYELSGSKYIAGDTITGIRGFVHLQDSSGAPLPIQLYKIFFGEKGLVSLDLDTLNAQANAPNGEVLNLDSLNLVLPDSADFVQPVSEP